MFSLRKMRQNKCAYLVNTRTCHGIQDATSPTDSGLCLANGRHLKVPDVIALSRSRGGLAFLSACQTATGDNDLSDEVIFRQECCLRQRSH